MCISGKLLVSFGCVLSVEQHRAMQSSGEEDNNSDVFLHAVFRFLMMLQVSDPEQLCG